MPRPSTAPSCRLAALATLFALAGCATAYGQRGFMTGGGYSDERLDDTHYTVRFNGNGLASKERVWNFWFYRCAELTLEKGYAYFDLESRKPGKQGLLDASPAAPPAAHARANANGLVVVPAASTFIFIPMPPVKTWNTSSVVAMYPKLPPGKTLFSAKRVMEQLAPYVKSGGSAEAPDRKTLFRGALVKVGSGEAEERIFPDGVTIGYVDWRRVAEGTSEGKAANARLQVWLAKNQAELDACKKRVDKVRKLYDAEADPARKAGLEDDIATAKKEVEERLVRFRTEYDAEQKQALRPMTERAGAIVERLRSERRLDTVTEQNLGGLWDVDLTDAVIEAYEAKYPAHEPPT